MPDTGFEPAIFALRGHCSTSWANPASKTVTEIKKMVTVQLSIQGSNLSQMFLGVFVGVFSTC